MLRVLTTNNMVIIWQTAKYLSSESSAHTPGQPVVLTSDQLEAATPTHTEGGRLRPTRLYKNIVEKYLRKMTYRGNWQLSSHSWVAVVKSTNLTRAESSLRSGVFNHYNISRTIWMIKSLKIVTYVSWLLTCCYMSWYCTMLCNFYLVFLSVSQCQGIAPCYAILEWYTF